MNSKCIVGTSLDDRCHKLIFAKLVGMKKINDFENEEIQLLVARTDLHFNEESEICYHYEKINLIRYESNFSTFLKKKL